MPSATQSWRPQTASKAIPFVVGIAVATILFAFFSLDLWHHWVPYSLHSPRSSVERLLPLLIWLAAVLVPTGLRWLRQWRSRSWPCTQSIIERASIQSVLRRQRTAYLLTVTYWYFVKGERYGGVYTEGFNAESDAQAVMNSLQSFPPPVRYKPGDPIESTMDPYRDARLTVPKRA